MRKMLVLLAVAVVGAVAATSAIAGGSSGLTAPRVIHVVERPVTDTLVDTGPKGDSPGDLLPFTNPIYDASNSHRVGSDQGNCVHVVGEGRWECAWTTFLGGGQITVEGPFFDFKSNSVLAVTGGTGTFRNARGQMVLHIRADGNFDFVFALQP
jgi:allene oxide cyclase